MFGDPGKNPNGYPTVKLSDIADYYGGLTYSPSDISQDGTIILRSSNIQDGRLAFSDTVRVKKDIKDRFFVKKNDILMCSRNGSANLVGKTALIDGLREPMAFGAFMMIIRSDYYAYLLEYLRHPAFKAQISTGTATINQITVRMLDSVKLPLPNMHEIKTYQDFVCQADKSKFTPVPLATPLQDCDAFLIGIPVNMARHSNKATIALFPTYPKRTTEACFAHHGSPCQRD